MELRSNNHSCPYMAGLELSSEINTGAIVSGGEVGTLTDIRVVQQQNLILRIAILKRLEASIGCEAACVDRDGQLRCPLERTVDLVMTETTRDSSNYYEGTLDAIE